MSYKCIVMDEFLPSTSAARIEKLLIGKEYPGKDISWNRIPFTNNEEAGRFSLFRREKDITWFAHDLVKEYKFVSEHANFILSPFSKIDSMFNSQMGLKMANLSRARINLVPPQLPFSYFNSSPFHVDNPRQHLVVIYYVNDCNGRTVLKNITKVHPKKNRLILFDGSIEHKIKYPTRGYRCVINFNFLRR